MKPRAVPEPVRHATHIPVSYPACAWRDFLGRKLVLCLAMAGMLMLTFFAAVLLSLVKGDDHAAKAMAQDMWTPFCTAIVTLAGAATAGNVMEHRERTKQGLTSGHDGPTT